MPLFCGSPVPASAEAARGKNGIVATGHPLATEAAVNAMKNGGNAIDAAVAAALTLGVVDGHNSGIGGGCFLLIRLASGEFVAIDGRETAPAAAHREMYVRDGAADPQLSQTGALAAGIPGALAAYDLALSKHGKLPLKDHLLHAAELAEKGFPIDGTYASRSRGAAEELAKFPDSRSIFLLPEDQPLPKGHVLLQPDLAKSYRAIAEEGIGWFYGGAFAEATEQWMQANGGILTAADLRDYRPQLREPIRTTYRGHEVVGFPPPSSGGVHVLQLLNIIETFDLQELKSGSTELIHMIAEAMKLVFADRAFWLGDPEFAKVPRGLISKEYAQQLAMRISMEAASPVESHSTPARAEEEIFGKHTTHFSTADAEGNWVACTATINTAFGSKVVIPGTGILLNNEMDDFAIQPGVPNAFNLVGGEANAVAAGKRPLSSMSPTIVLKDDQPVLAIGAAGGPTIISQTLLAVVQLIDFGTSVEAAVAAPRFHHQWKPGELKIERSVPEEVREALRQRGHELSEVNAFGACQAIGRDTGSGDFVGTADPRGNGAASGW